MKIKIYKFTEKGKVLHKEVTYTKKDIENLKTGNYLPKSLIKIAKQQRRLKKVYAPIERLDTKKIIFDKLGITTINQKTNPIKPITNILHYNSVFYKMNTPFKNYLDTYNNLYNSIKTLETNPFSEYQKALKKRLNEYLKAKKEYETNPFYLEDKKEKEIIEKAFNKLEKQLKKALKIKEREITNKAYQLLSQTYKQKPKPITNTPISLNPNFDDFNGQIEIIHKETQTLFISTLEQWKQLFSDDIPIFKKPIELKNKTTIADLRLFLGKLKEKDLIKKSKFNTIIETKKAFSFNGLIITADQLKNAKQNTNYPNTLNSNSIDVVFKVLKLD